MERIIKILERRHHRGRYYNEIMDGLKALFYRWRRAIVIFCDPLPTYCMAKGDVYTPNSARKLKYHDLHVLGDFDCTQSRIKTLEGCPREVGENFFCGHNTALTSLANIHTYIRRIGKHLYIPPNVESNILGLLKIRDLKMVFVQPAPVLAGRLQLALDIINQHLVEKPNPRDRDIHQAQIELIEAGFVEYAAL